MANKIELPDIELVSAQVHAQWMETKRSQGVTSRKSETGEELMVDYALLSEPAKDLDRNTVKTIYRAIQALMVWLLAVSSVQAQTDPRTLPLWDDTQVVAEGTVTFDWQDGAGGDVSYGGQALAVSEDGRFLYSSCNPNTQTMGLAKLALGPVGSRLAVVEPCLGPTRADIFKILNRPWDAGQPSIGGLLEQGGRVAVSVFGSYDANDTALASHFVGSDLRSLQGPFRGQVRPGLIKGSMAPIPSEWRTVLGGPAFATSDYTSIISRGSDGPVFVVIDPAQMAQANFPAQMLLGCPHLTPGCATWTAWGPSSMGFEGAELAGGAFIVPGTRTLVYVEREALGTPAPGTTGPNMEGYGYPTNDPTLHGTPHPGPEGVRWIYSLADPMAKGNKGYPYALVAKLFDLNHLVEVKEGRARPEQITPYKVIVMPGSHPGQIVTQGAFNPVNKKLYLLELSQGGTQVLKVFGGFGPGSSPPPPPPDEKCGDGIDNDLDGLIDEGCPQQGLTVITTVQQCRVTVQNSPPDSSPGWSVQFRYDQNNFGSRDASAPFERSRNFSPGTYVLSGVWSKSGRADVVIPTLTFAVASDCK